MQKSQLKEVINKSIEIQGILFNRLKTESDTKAREWTSMQITYQKSIYKTAFNELCNNKAFTVDGIKMVDQKELLDYFREVC